MTAELAAAVGRGYPKNAFFDPAIDALTQGNDTAVRAELTPLRNLRVD